MTLPRTRAALLTLCLSGALAACAHTPAPPAASPAATASAPVAPAAAPAPSTVVITDPFATPAETVVARVDDEPVLWSSVLFRLGATWRTLDAAPDAGVDVAARRRALLQETLDAVVDGVLVRSEAARARIDVTDAEVDEAAETVARQHEVTLDGLYAAAAEAGITRDAYRDVLATELLRMRLLIGYGAYRLHISEAQVADAYRQRAAQVHCDAPPCPAIPTLAATHQAIFEALTQEALQCQSTAMIDGYRRRHRVRYLVEGTRRPDSAAVPDPPPVAVGDVVFEGNHELPTAALRAALLPMAVDDRVAMTREGRLNGDALVLLQVAYYEQGFLDVAIDNPTASNAVCSPVVNHGVVRVVEGPRFRIGAVRVRELDAHDHEVAPLGGRPAVLAALHAVPGAWFARSTLAQGVAALQTRYRDAGYAMASVTPSVTPTAATPTATPPVASTVDYTVDIRRGPIVTIERVDVRGNAAVPTASIVAATGLAAGQRYSESAYQRAVTQVRALAGLAQADVSTELVADHPDRLVIAVDVRER